MLMIIDNSLLFVTAYAAADNLVLVVKFLYHMGVSSLGGGSRLAKKDIS